MARRRRRHIHRPFLMQPGPLACVVIGTFSLTYSLWPSKADHPPKLMSEVQPQAVPVTPGIKPLVSPAEGAARPMVTAVQTRKPAAPKATAAAASPEPPRVQITVPPGSQPSVSRPQLSGSPTGTLALQEGLAARGRNEWLRARELLNRALQGGLSHEQMETARQSLTEIANHTVFSTSALPGDPLVEAHQIGSGESLNKLARRYAISEDLLAEVNRIKDKHFVRQGMRLKVLHGPFQAVIVKSDHLLHVFLGDTYVRSYRVALGADGRTPTGKWKVIDHQTNPGWTDPHTGKRYHPDDPNNPLGEYWISVEGVEGACVGAVGYGIHGTNEPQTIGQDVSLGCVRLGPEDIAAVYKLLVPGQSYVTITD